MSKYKVKVFYCIGCMFNDIEIYGENLEDAVNNFYKTNSGVEIIEILE
jgi:hypothetical protein